MATIDINQYIEQSGMRKARFGGYEPDDVRQAMLDLCSDYEQRLNTAAQQVRGAQQEAEALRRRCAYLYIQYPDLEKEVAIIQARRPNVNEHLAVQVARAVQALRDNQAILKKPSIAETLDWVAALEALGISDLTAEAAERTKGFVLKNSEDWAAMAGQPEEHRHCGGCGEGQ